MTPDQINATLELTGAVFTFRNALRVYRDRGYAGITWTAVAFFTTWGFWNIWYYPSLHQSWSFAAAVLLLAANLLWVSAMAWFGPIVRKTAGYPKNTI